MTLIERLRAMFGLDQAPTLSQQDTRAMARTEDSSARTNESVDRADKAIAEWRRVDALASQKAKVAGKAVTDLREAQQDATDAGERLIDQVEGAK